MTERSAPAVQPGLPDLPSQPESSSVPGRARTGGPARTEAPVEPVAGQAHQPMKLVTVLRHVLALDHGNGADAPAGPSPSAGSASSRSSRAPAVGTHSASLAVIDVPALRRMNNVLRTALDICLELDTARLQLQNAISTQREMETVLEMVAARMEAGHPLQTDHRRITTLLMAERDKVSEAVREWNRIGRRFAQHTHLLPAQLESVVDIAGPLPPDEMDRLAEACLSTHADVHFSLHQHARAQAEGRAAAGTDPRRAPEDFHGWISRMEEVRAQAAADFASARESYLEAALQLDREHAGYVRARSLRRTAETGFRHGSGSALQFAHAILEEGQRMHAVLALQASRLNAKHHLVSLAGLLPKQFGLVGPQTWH